MPLRPLPGPARRGRPRLEEGGVSLHWGVKIPPSLAAKIDKMAAKKGSSRSDLVRTLLEKALGNRRPK